MIDALEKYLLQSGKYRKFFRIYFLIRYYASISLLTQYYTNWDVIQEGIHPHDTFRIFLKTYNWTFAHYCKVSNACLYLDKIEAVTHRTAKTFYNGIASGTVITVEIYLRRKRHKSIREVIVDMLFKKEVDHA